MEQFHGQYIVIGIQAITCEGSELQHVHSTVMEVGAGSTQFDVDGMLNNLSSSSQGELADLLRSKYSPWTAADVNSESRRLNQLLQFFAQFSRLASVASPAPRLGVTPIAASHVIALGSDAQASNMCITTWPSGRAVPRVHSCIEDEQPESAWKQRRSSASVGSSGSDLT